MPARPQRWPGWLSWANSPGHLAEQIDGAHEPSLHEADDAEDGSEPGLAVHDAALDRHLVADLGHRGRLLEPARVGQGQGVRHHVHAGA